MSTCYLYDDDNVRCNQHEWGHHLAKTSWHQQRDGLVHTLSPTLVFCPHNINAKAHPYRRRQTTTGRSPILIIHYAMTDTLCTYGPHNYPPFSAFFPCNYSCVVTTTATAAIGSCLFSIVCRVQLLLRFRSREIIEEQNNLSFFRHFALVSSSLIFSIPQRD